MHRSTIGWWFIIWILIHVYFLHNAGIRLELALIDASIFALLLAVTSFGISFYTAFYKPRSEGYLPSFLIFVAFSFLLVYVDRNLVMFLPATLRLSPDALQNTRPFRFVSSFLIMSCVAMLSTQNYALHEEKSKHKSSNDLSEAGREAELFKLQQQLKPHFLFNSLNSIYSLLGSSPVKAREMIAQLSEFLRGTILHDSKMNPLSLEIDHIKLYLAIEQARFGDRLNVEITFAEDLGTFPIPSFILQPLIENAIKFGLYGVTGQVTLSMTITPSDSKLNIVISNPFDPTETGHIKGSGFGITATRRRLYLLYGRTDLLVTRQSGTTFSSVLTLPWIGI